MPRSALFTAIYAHRLLEKDKGIGFGQGADTLGAVLITASLMLGVYTIVEPAAKDGWGAPLTLGLGAGSLILLALFMAREASTENPLIPLRIFRSRNVTGANLVQVLTVAGMFGVFFMGSLYLQQVQGYDALQIGLAFLPVTIIMGTLTGRYSEPLIMRFGARRLLFPGLALVAAGLAYFTRAPVDGNYVVYVLPVLILLGTGVGDLLPGADDARDVGRDAGRRRPRLGPGQHLRPGRRRARPGGARDAVHVSHRQSRGRRALHGLGADQRLITWRSGSPRAWSWPRSPLPRP